MSMYGTIEQVKNKTGITADDLNVADTTELDDFITDLLTAASQVIEEYTDRDFEKHSGVTETYDGGGSPTLMLRNNPVISISSVKVDEDELASDKYRIKGVTSFGKHNGGILKRLDGHVFRSGTQNVEVTYTWGYENPPSTIVNVAEEIAGEMLKTAANNYKTGGLESMSMSDFSTKFNVQRPLTESQRQRLKTYKKVIYA